MPLSPSLRLASIDDLLLYRLGRLSATAGALVVRLCEGGYGITRREWAVVAQLYENGALPPSALAERMHRDRARTSRTLTSLVKKQLVTRTVTPADRRRARVALTPVGRQLYDQLMPSIQAINGQILSALQANEVVLFDDALARLQARAQRLVVELDPHWPKANRRRGLLARSPA
ncbi:MarR family winged helix-turn-helix transcriptional regulator [Limnohabitans sp. Rim8]|jgi:DNA-binding MarR family transcriptional regulator|uniref:MarR family winged helix-turn-helix transcriptional regulator n=1 Tax=Limnohabitans sp. Rim8 TaxID=1100718 RepID=UPI0025DC9406|nr:MarR family transcriptional regulator [Limnohabitans sp. Rim8]